MLMSATASLTWTDPFRVDLCSCKLHCISRQRFSQVRVCCLQVANIPGEVDRHGTERLALLCVSMGSKKLLKFRNPCMNLQCLGAGLCGDQSRYQGRQVEPVKRPLEVIHAPTPQLESKARFNKHTHRQSFLPLAILHNTCVIVQRCAPALPLIPPCFLSFFSSKSMPVICACRICCSCDTGRGSPGWQTRSRRGSR